MSPLAMAEWIEIALPPQNGHGFKSPLAMAEWIEIISSGDLIFNGLVSASDGGVD